jgi:hypothetical protein
MKLKLTLLVMLVVLLATACGSAATPSDEPTPDVAAIRTSAASTVVSQFTLTAAAFTPTASQPTQTRTPQTTGTATATATGAFAQVTDASGTVIALCDSLEFVVDVNVPDGTNMSPGQDFLKTWRVKNTGSCTWGADYKLIYSYGERMSGQWQPLNQVVQPGQEVELSVSFKAPDKVGEYVSAWQMTSPKGAPFGPAIFVKIIVQ